MSKSRITTYGKATYGQCEAALRDNALDIKAAEIKQAEGVKLNRRERRLLAKKKGNE